MSHPFWPLFDVRVRTPSLELRLPTDDDLHSLIEAARTIDGAPGVFASGWATLPDPAFGHGIAQFQWRTRAEWTPEAWTLPFGVFVDGEIVGLQDVGAKQFGRLGEVSTGSWVTSARAGAGVGTEMRAAVLWFAFEALGATIARSAARTSNVASMRVSEKLGYAVNGTARLVFGDDEVAQETLLVLDRAGWAESATSSRTDISVEGVDACLDMFGAVVAPT